MVSLYVGVGAITSVSVRMTVRPDVRCERVCQYDSKCVSTIASVSGVSVV